MSMRYFCCDEQPRRSEIARRPDLNGIDFLEVLDNDSMPADKRQRTLFVHFVNDPSGLSLDKENVLIRGGEREECRDPQVTDIRIGLDPRSGTIAPVMIVEVEHPGDYSMYTLKLVPKDAADHRLDHFDPLMLAVDFSFKVSCESKFDCLEKRVCLPEPKHEPAIDYLARDFASFRQLMLDRFSILMPDWQERNPADWGIALIELLAYVGDYLSYRQDAISTEAYLDTARRRVSVRRHARLVDYLMHDGCNARAWVHVEVKDVAVTLRKGTQFLTAIPGLPDRIQEDSNEYRKAIGAGAEVFESLHEASLFPSLNELHFYTWGARECCLPKGATRATLHGRLTELKPGMVLIFQEVCSPRTGDPADADLRRRHAVRLKEVTYTVDPIGGSFNVEPSDTPLDVTQITWADEDALPFPLCISAEADEGYDGRYIEEVSIALGNIVLADHGRRIKEENIGQVPKSSLQQIRSGVECGAAGCIGEEHDRCRSRSLETVPPRFRPTLKEIPLTQAAPYDDSKPPASARAAMNWDMKDILPQITLKSIFEGREILWKPQRDLINSNPDQNEFVVEVEADERAYLRFGDGRFGSRPSPEAEFTADYRVGNGIKGNVGAEMLAHVVSDEEAITKVVNPMAAYGGINMESIERVRQSAPEAFRTQKRAVTADDYADMATRHQGVQKAVARLRWTGSWHTVFVSVDRMGGVPLDDKFEEELRNYLEPFRMAGHDLEIDHPSMIPLEIGMEVGVNPGYERSCVRTALMQIFSNRNLPDGRRGVFYPDNFSFGQTVYLSPFYAAAQAIDGVDSVAVTTFQRQDSPGTEGLENGKLTFGRYEIPRLDNDPNFPGRGSFHLNLRGGR